MNIFQKVTLKNLKENRTRTLVTIIGIILSAAMFTAVTVSISSLRHYLISHTIYNHGSWYGAAYDLTLQNADSISDDEEISDSVRMNRLGYAWLSDSVNENKPYLCVYGIDEKFTDLMPVHLTEGRMPQNNNEILLPEHLAANGGIHYQLDDTLSLELGTRVSSDGETLGNHNPYYPEENYDERLENKKSYTYTVVGFYERPDFEDYSAPGYTALTISDLTGEGVYDLYFRTTDGAEIVNYIDTHISPIMEYKDDFEISYTMNYDLLRLYGYSGESSYNLVMFNLAVILIIIIAFGSISLIYNAFSISVSERTKQFGLLSSIGATRHQLTGSVLFEAFFLSIIGIPLGLLSGTVGIGVTFYFISDMITGYLFSDTTTSLTLHASLPALATAVCISLITILISAWLPARRAMKGSAIDAIRQTKDITIRAGKLKTSPLAYRLFGFEGMLAAKNYKRNKRKYRATVISLFLSIVLFISTSSFCAYLMKSADDILVTQGYDISYSLLADTDISPEDLEEELSGVSGVSFSSYYTFMTLGGMVNSASLSEDYFNYNASFTLDGTYAFAKSDEVYSYFNLYFVKDDVFRDYLKENRLSEDDYFNSASPKAVMVDTMHTYYKDRYHTFSMFDSCEDGDITLYLPRTSEELSYTGFGYDIDGNVFYRYNQNSPEGEVLNYTELP